MESFLDKLAGELLERHGTFESVAVVFPTRRAGLFFKDALARRLQQPAWTPVLYSIQDFIREFSGVNIPDNLSLQVELYAVYKRYYPGETFSDFLPWADVMLGDFDEADRYMASIPALFRNVTELHELKEAFGLAPEDEERIRGFWQTFYGTSRSPVKDEFHRTWLHLQAIYNDFRQALSLKNQAYEGMAYRMLCESLEKGEKEIPHSTTVFAGLYALSTAEERIVQSLVDRGKAACYWDTDAYYTDDPRQEAGLFIRKSRLVQGTYPWKFNDFATQPRNIVSIAVPLQVGQARSAGEMVDDLVRKQGCDPRRIAVVLADERLLFPVLYSLPESVPSVNVTMGFPLKESPLHSFIESLVRLQQEARRGGDDGGNFYHRHVGEILSHPVMRSAEPAFYNQWHKSLRDQRRMRWPVTTLAGAQSPALARAIFRIVEPTGLCSYLLAVLDELLLLARQRNERAEIVESEFLFRWYTLLNRLREMMPVIGEDVSFDTFWRLLSGIAAQVKIPFSGEPLRGLQVMGMLESRLLDFDQVIMLSVNEDILPSAAGRVSFIPYGIRKAFGLPGPEEHQAVSAYHFFRLLQRASRVALLYNSEAGGLVTGERSRFVSQLELEMAVRHPGTVRFEERVSIAGFVPPVSPAVTVKKSTAVMEALDKYRPAGQATGPYIKKLSPSALSAYIQCPLKFYLQYVAGLREQEDAEDTMDAGIFGKVLHDAMQSLYAKGITYGKQDLENLQAMVFPAVDEAIRRQYLADAEDLEGKDIILRQVLHQLVSGILKLDAGQAPFTVRYLEETFTREMRLSSGKTFLLGGVVDRIDETGGMPRILDYKTGNVRTSAPKEFELLFTNPKYKEQFQALFYAWLYARVSGHESVLSGLVMARQLQDGIFYLNGGKPLDASGLRQFEERLLGLLEEIANPDIPFSQTDDSDRCTYCAFREMCGR